MERMKLNLDGNNLWVFEPSVNKNLIESMKKGIEETKKGIVKGVKFPPVDVVRKESGIYEICYYGY